MKLSDVIKSLEDYVDNPLEYKDEGFSAMYDLMHWARKANEALISLDALYGEKLSDEFAHQVSSLIDTEVQ